MKKLFVIACCLLFSTLTFGNTLPNFSSTVFPWLQTAWMTKYTQVDDFRGDDFITRWEAAKFVTQYAQAIQLEKTYYACEFTDLAWYDATLIPFIQQACTYGLLKGSNGKFMPNDLITEAQALAVVQRSLWWFTDETLNPWYKMYYMNGQDLKFIYNETLDSVWITNITRKKFWSWFFVGYEHYKRMHWEELVQHEKKETTSNTSQSSQKKLELIINWLFPRRPDAVDWTFGGFGVRFSTNDVYENAINTIVQWTVPDNYCLSFVNNSIPLDFAYVRRRNGDRVSYHDWMKTYQYDKKIDEYKVLYCWVTDFKILLPKQPNFFNLWFGVGFISMFEESTYPACIRLFVSADNAQYEETAFCVQKGISLGTSFQEAVSNELIKILKL